MDDDAMVRQYATPANLSARIALHERFGSAEVPWQTWVFDQLELQPGDRCSRSGAAPGRCGARTPAGSRTASR